MADLLDFPLLVHALINEHETLEHNLLKKELRQQSSPLDLPNGVFKKIYRCDKTTAEFLINELSPLLPDPDRDTEAIPKDVTILCALNFYAQGSYQKAVGQDMNCPMSQSAVSRCIEVVTNAIIERFQHKVKFPTSNDEKENEKQKFFELLNG